MRNGSACLGILLAALVGCRSRSPAREAPADADVRGLGSAATLGGAVARVGSATIGASLVEQVARAQGLSAERATQTLLEEAILAEAAVHQGALRDPNVLRLLDLANARAAVARAREAALAEGPFTDDDIQRAMGDDEWIDLDAPQTRTVVHALIPKDVKDGATLAEALRARLADAKDDADFLATAKAFGAERGVAVVAETLDQPFTADGRIALRGAGGAALDKTFSKAAFALDHVGAESPVVATPFGWHVIRLTKIIPERRTSRAHKLEALAPVLLRNRAFAPFQARLAKLRAEAHAATTASSSDLVTPRFSPAEPPR